MIDKIFQKVHFHIIIFFKTWTIINSLEKHAKSSSFLLTQAEVDLSWNLRILTRSSLIVFCSFNKDNSTSLLSKSRGLFMQNRHWGHLSPGLSPDQVRFIFTGKDIPGFSSCNPNLLDVIFSFLILSLKTFALCIKW